MKRNIKFLLTSLFLIVTLGLWISSPISAKGQDQNRVQDPTTHDGDVVEADLDSTGNGQGSAGSPRAGLENAIQTLTRVSERFNNPETGEQVRTMTENHTRSQEKINTALSSMRSRSKLLKFVFGANYQNAGEVKAQAAQFRSDAEDLAKFKEELTYASDQEEMQDAIDNLEGEADALETELNQELQGFSLFGWLNRILSGY